jgi:hypothetical protein
MRVRLAVGIVAGSVLAACSLLVKLDAQQCNSDTDCQARGSAFGGAVCVNQVCVAPLAEAGSEAGVSDAANEGGGEDAGDGAVDPWGCVSLPPETLNPNQVIQVTVTSFDALKPITTEGPQGSDLVPVTYSAVTGATVEACGTFDPACAGPVATATTNDAGVAQVTVHGDFVGFYRLTAPGYLGSATYPGQLLQDASAESITTAMLGTNELQLLAAALGVTVDTSPDAGVGHAFFEAFDCFDHHAAGVVFTMQGDAGADTVQWYTRNNAPSTTATETDTLGTGGAVNVPTGALTVTASLGSSGKILGTINPIIGAGTTTFAFIRVRTH